MHASKLQQIYQRTRIPMPIIDEIAQTMHDVLTKEAEQAGRTSGVVQRQSKLDGAAFVQTLVFSSLSDPDATVDDLAQTAATVGIPITGPGSVQRCTEAAATCLQTVLGTAVQRVLAADPTTVLVLQRFAGVSVQDSTTIVVPPDLTAVWRGCGGSTDGMPIARARCARRRWSLVRGIWLTWALSTWHASARSPMRMRAGARVAKLPRSWMTRMARAGTR
jgi:hypothetical protein